MSSSSSSSRARPERERSSPPAEDVRNLFVSGIGDETTTEELKKAFKKFGTLKSVRIPRDMATQRHKGYGFVTFEEVEDAEEALKTPIKVDGREVHVEVAKEGPKEKGAPRSSRSMRYAPYPPTRYRDDYFDSRRSPPRRADPYDDYAVAMRYPPPPHHMGRLPPDYPVPPYPYMRRPYPVDYPYPADPMARDRYMRGPPPPPYDYRYEREYYDRVKGDHDQRRDRDRRDDSRERDRYYEDYYRRDREPSYERREHRSSRREYRRSEERGGEEHYHHHSASSRDRRRSEERGEERGASPSRHRHESASPPTPKDRDSGAKTSRDFPLTGEGNPDSHDSRYRNPSSRSENVERGDY